MSNQAYQEELYAAIDAPGFVRLTLSGVIRGPAVPWRKITVRPVAIKDQRQLQFSYFDDRQDITKNAYGAAAEERLKEALGMGWSAITLEMADERRQWQITKKGKVIAGRAKQAAAPDLSHNRTKALPLPAGRPDAFLQATGIMGPEGNIRADKQRKFTQINAFLQLLDTVIEPQDRPLRILDCGCGSAYLTFAAYHYLNTVRKIPALVVGIDTNAALIAKNQREAQRLGAQGIEFIAAEISTWQPDEAPDLVLALHACDTATDDALALAVRSKAKAIMCAPCCHQHLNSQLDPALMRPVLRHGILLQRQADLLTDALRAQILRIAGYRSDILEFVTFEHSGRNLLIRAVATDTRHQRQDRADYQKLVDFWQVRPYLAELLASELALSDQRPPT